MRIESLTSLRWVAALTVFALHAYDVYDLPGPKRLYVVLAAQGLSFFFVLSGFVLAWSRPDGDTPARFYRRRVARLYPPYLVAFCGGAGLNWWFGLRHEVGWEGLFGLVGVQAWIPDRDFYFAWNAVAWTLSVEAFFYLCFPVLAGLALRSRRRWAVIAGCAAVYTAVVVIFDGPDPWFRSVFPPVRMLEFTAGVYLGTQLRHGTALRVPPTVAWAAVGVAGVIGLSGTVLVTVPSLLLVAATAVTDRWRDRRLVFLGTVSYAFYLVHQPILYALDRTGPLLGFGVSLLVAVGLWRFVERPCEARLRPVPQKQVGHLPDW